MSIRRMFAGGNTPQGFVNFFDDILPVHTATKRYFLKGASGSGKSTFMKKIVKQLNVKDVDLYHCSNDVNSLDAICIPEKGICIVDGTAPHVCDPLVPGAVDVILNFANYIDAEQVKPYVGEIQGILKQKKIYVEEAYQYLAAAGRLHNMNVSVYRRSLKEGELSRTIEKSLAEFAGHKIADHPAANRKHFATAITPDGRKSFTEKILANRRVIGLYGEAGMGMERFMDEVGKKVRADGFMTESFYCPMDPRRVEHLIVPELNLAYTTIGAYHPYPRAHQESIDFRELMDYTNIEEEELHYCTRMFDELVEKAIRRFKAARDLHDRVEEIYVASMNFKRLDHLTDKILKNIVVGEV